MAVMLGISRTEIRETLHSLEMLVLRKHVKTRDFIAFSFSGSRHFTEKSRLSQAGYRCTAEFCL